MINFIYELDKFIPGDSTEGPPGTALYGLRRIDIFHNVWGLLGAPRVADCQMLH